MDAKTFKDKFDKLFGGGDTKSKPKLDLDSLLDLTKIKSLEDIPPDLLKKIIGQSKEDMQNKVDEILAGMTGVLNVEALSDKLETALKRALPKVENFDDNMTLMVCLTTIQIMALYDPALAQKWIEASLAGIYTTLLGKGTEAGALATEMALKIPSEESRVKPKAA